jgi:RNA polymerase sigma-32 factor
MRPTSRRAPTGARRWEHADDGHAADAKPAEVPQVGGALVPIDNLARYLAEIRRIPVLSREEEHELAVDWKEKGDRQAAWRLVTSNLRLVVMVARDYQRAVHNLLDLVQEGTSVCSKR